MSNDDLSTHREGTYKGHALSYVLLGIFFLVIIYKSFLLESFWLDECITGWIITGGIGQVFERTITFQGQSPLYYILLWFWSQIVGISEPALRSLSLLCLLISSFQLYKITIRVAGKEAARFSVPLFFSLSPVLVALSARPYALALMCALSSLRLLFCYIDTRRAFVLTCYALSVLVTFYVHYLFLAFFLVHVAAIYCFVQKDEYVKVSRAVVLALLCVAPLSIPGFYHLRALLLRSKQIAFLPIPGWSEIVQQFLPPALLVGAFVALALAALLFKGFTYRRMEDRQITFFLIWFAVLPAAALASALMGLTNLFHPRYLLWCSVGAAPFIGGILSGIAPPYLRERAFCIMLVTLIFAESQRVFLIEEWRSAALLVARDPETPVLLATGLAEGEIDELRRDPTWQEYLSAPFMYYQVPNKIKIIGTGKLPNDLSEDTAQKKFFFVTPRKNYVLFTDRAKDDQRKSNVLSDNGKLGQQVIVGEIVKE